MIQCSNPVFKSMSIFSRPSLTISAILSALIESPHTFTAVFSQSLEQNTALVEEMIVLVYLCENYLRLYTTSSVILICIRFIICFIIFVFVFQYLACLCCNSNYLCLIPDRLLYKINMLLY